MARSVRCAPWQGGTKYSRSALHRAAHTDASPVARQCLRPRREPEHSLRRHRLRRSSRSTRAARKAGMRRAYYEYCGRNFRASVTSGVDDTHAFVPLGFFSSAHIQRTLVYDGCRRVCLFIAGDSYSVPLIRPALL